MACLKLNIPEEKSTALKVVHKSLRDNENSCSGAYRFGHQGQEKDDEIFGSTGTAYAYKFRMYDARIGRFMSIDPLTQDYPELTPYQYASNTPIWYFEIEGLEGSPYTKKRVYATIKVTTGIVGVEVKIFGMPVGYVYSAGGFENEAKIWIDFYPDGEINLGATFTHREVAEGSSDASVGPFSGGEKETRESTTEISTNYPAEQDKEKVFTKEESGGYGPLRTSETEEGEVYSLDLGAEIQALILGAGVNVGIEEIPLDDEGR